MIWFIGWSDEYSTNWLVGKVGWVARLARLVFCAGRFIRAGGGLSPGHKKTGSRLTAGRFLEVSSGFEPLYKLLQSLA